MLVFISFSDESLGVSTLSSVEIGPPEPVGPTGAVFFKSSPVVPICVPTDLDSIDGSGVLETSLSPMLPTAVGCLRFPFPKG